ncbi:MAG: ADP-ribosylglycohydrolase family protein [Deltaproteobacteria bacterium]|nr:ADP-ribosylglycohydrolase family protein [Deltaproteobacteria bacterium]
MSARSIALASCLALTACEGPTAPMDAEPSRDTDRSGATDTSLERRALIERCFVPLDLSREAYADRLRGLWLAENVANWTGLLTEAERRAPPFFTDADWGTPRGRFGIEGSAGQTITLNTLDPWGADDDTDIEMIYLEAMRRAGSAHLSPMQIRDAWRRHIEPDIYVWVSNAAARRLFDAEPPVLPPSTSLLGANDQALMIDAQLTTEIFGALSPGRPAHALGLAHTPILTTATGFAAHAAQLYVVLYALAPVLDPSLDPRDQIHCLLDAAARTIPTESKALDVLDEVLAQEVSLSIDHADHDDWELARDAIARRFQEEGALHGYRYLEWYESAVNFATGILALVFGDGDLLRTIQIGTLSGWDSDNGTATMGGLLGLMHGEAWVRGELSRAGLTELSDRYRIARTRYAFPQEIYTLDEIAALALPRVEESLRETGGSIDGGRFVAERVREDELSLAANPYVAWLAPSATRHARGRGETPIARLAAGTLEGTVPLEVIVDGLELDASGTDPQLPVRDEAALARGESITSRHARASGAGVSFEVTWASAQRLIGARFVEGPVSMGEVSIEVLGEDGWTSPALARDLEPATGAFAFRDAIFATPIEARGVRITSPAGEATLLELDGLLAAE